MEDKEIIELYWQRNEIAIIKTKEKYGRYLLEKDAQPGNVMLKGEDGSVLLATPYWPQNKKEKNALSWLVTGVKENIRYTATYFELYSNEKFIEEIVFIPGKNGKLQAVSWEAPEMP